MKILLPVPLHHVTRRRLSGKNMRQADVALDAHFLRHGRMAQIGVDKQHALADFGDGGRGIGCRGGLAFARPGRREDEQMTVFLDIRCKEGDIRANLAELFRFFTTWLRNNDRPRFVKQFRTLNRTERRSLGQLAHIGGALDTRVDHVKQQRHADSADQAKHHARCKVQPDFRRARRLRRTGLLHEVELNRGFRGFIRVQGR